MIAVLLAATIVTVSIGDLAKLQRLSDAELRARFGLPEECDPTLTASGDRHDRIIVAITCRSGDRPSPGRKVR
jgi:hypothetical protein